MALARYQAMAQDSAGNALASPTVEVRVESTAALATLFSDRAGATPMANPFTGDADGLFAFHVKGGAYKITVTKDAVTRTFRYVGIGTAAETDVPATDIVYAKDYGVRADGATDDTVSLQAAISATPAGGTLILPHGLCKVLGSGSQCLLVQQAINIIGSGWGTGLVANAALPNTRDILAVIPLGASRGYSFRDFYIAAGGLGRHALYLNGDTAGGLIYNINIQRMLIEPTAAGYSIFGTGNDAGGGVFAYSGIRDCNFDCLKIDTLGDGIDICGNVIGGTGTHASITITQVVGAGGLNINNNVLTGTGGGVIVERGYPVIDGNEFEQYQNSTNTHGAMLDLNGGTGYGVNACKVINNTFSVTAGVTGITNVIRLDKCTDTLISGNRISARGASANHIAITANASDTGIVANAYITDDVRVGLNLSDSGLRSGAASAEHFLALTANQTGQNVNTAQTWFPGGGPTQITVLANSTYAFEGILALARTAGTTSHFTSLLFGGTASVSSIAYSLSGLQTTGGFFASGNEQTAFVQVATTTSLFATNATANEHLFLQIAGIVRFTTGGSFIPQFQYSAAPGGAPSVQANSFFQMRIIGRNTVTGIGFN